VKFSCKKIFKNNADVNIKVAIENNYSTSKLVTATVKLIDRSGRKIIEDKKMINCNALANRSVVDFSFEIKDPIVWSVDAPTCIY